MPTQTTHGRCAPQTSIPWKESTTSYAVTSTQRWSSSDVFHLARAMLSKSSCCSRKCSQSMNSRSPLLWQWSSTCKCPVCQFWDFLGYYPWDLEPHYLQSNGFAEACVKSVKHALQCAKYSGANLQLTPLVLWATPIAPSCHHPPSSCTNASLGPPFLPESATLTQQPYKFVNRLRCSDAFKSQADKCCKSLAPLYAGQPIAMYDTFCKIWIPAAVVCIISKPTDTVPDTTKATLQAPARPHISAPQPAPTNHAQLAQPLPAAPTMPVTPKPQTTALPTMPAVPKVAPSSQPVTPNAAPVQPRRSGCAHTAPKHLIQKM